MNMANWIETITGPLEQKKQWRAYKARIEALPEPYGTVAKALQRYFMVYGGITDGETSVKMFGDFADLWESAYGQLVLAKLFWVALLLALAAFNKLRLTPALLRGDSSALGELRISIRTEMAVAGIVLLATAAFTTAVGPTPR